MLLFNSPNVRIRHTCCIRLFSSRGGGIGVGGGSARSSSFTVNMPSPSTKSWERSAKLVKNTDTTNQYLEHIRDIHDPSMQLKTLEDELKGTMGKALGKQGEKVLYYLQKMNEEREKYVKILLQMGKRANIDKGQEGKKDLDLNLGIQLDSEDVEALSEKHKEEIYRIVQGHNQYRKDAMKARWELLVHRQAVGFITNNHRFVHEKFPIPENIVLPEGFGRWSSIEGGDHGSNSSNRMREPVTRNFGDQLHWWESIGRWR